jgi:hypothetical protein
VARRVAFMVKLRDGVSADDYERFVRDVTYPFVRGVDSIRSYSVVRVRGLLEGGGELPYDFVETGEIDDFDAYMAELSPERPEVKTFDEQWLAHVAEAVAVYGDVIEDAGG